ncbi:MAG: type IV pilus assembly protein PilM [Patescibacteria group bacterium]
MLGLGTSSVLGVDIGTTSIKTVELQKEKGRIKLKNYGEYIPPSSKKELLPVEAGLVSFFEEGVANIIKEIIKEAKIKARDLVLSLPVFSSFFTLIELPLMEPKEIPSAIRFQAYQYIPVPIEEVVLNWVIIQEREVLLENRIQVLLVAVPRDIIDKYMKIAKILSLNLKALEVESFAEARSLAPEGEPVAIVNIGGRATSVTVIDNGFIRVCHNLEVSGFDLTNTLSKRMGISFERAEEIQKNRGITKAVDTLVSPILIPIVEKVIFGIEGAINSYLSKNPQKKIKKVILSGGAGNMPGLKEYFASRLALDVERANPFSEIVYPPVLNDILGAIGPSFSVAVGLALREFTEKK